MQELKFLRLNAVIVLLMLAAVIVDSTDDKKDTHDDVSDIILPMPEKRRTARASDYEYENNPSMFMFDSKGAVTFPQSTKEKASSQRTSSASTEVTTNKRNEENISYENSMNLEKRKNYKKQYNRKFKYDPALALMGLGKRISQFDPALRYMGLGKRRSSYDPGLKYMGLGKRSSNYDPALKNIELGKRDPMYDPALKYMGLGKRDFMYDPALKFMGLGKKDFMYDPALRYMGLGKRDSLYDPALKYMGLGKRGAALYDPALRYMGLGKRGPMYDPALRYMGLGKRGSMYDPALMYMGLGRRSSMYDPALRYMGLGKRSSLYDPALRYMGLGKKDALYDPALKYMGLGKRDFQNDSSKNFANENSSVNEFPLNLATRSNFIQSNGELQKRTDRFDPALRYMGLGKRDFTDDQAVRHRGLGKLTHENYSLTLPNGLEAQMGEDSEILGTQNLPLKKRGLKYILNRNYKVSDRNFNNKFEKLPGLGKRPYKFDPALRLMGLGKRDKSNADNLPERENSGKMNLDTNYMNLMNDESSGYNTEIDKRQYKLDPALRYMGLGKRDLTKRLVNAVDISASSPESLNENNIKYKIPYDVNAQEPSYPKSETTFQNTVKSNENKLLDVPIVSNGKFEIHKTPTSSNLMSEANDFYVQRYKRSNKYDPALRYMGLGKRDQVHNQKFVKSYIDDKGSNYETENNDADFPKIQTIFGDDDKTNTGALQLNKHSNKSNSCEGKCQRRAKREIKLRNELNPPHFEDNGKMFDLIPTTKRQRDNRPRYNPGWIFIGLGKRSDLPVKVDTSSEKQSENVGDVNYSSYLDDYYELLGKVKDKIQEMNLDSDSDTIFDSSPKIQLLMDPPKPSAEARDEYLRPSISDLDMSGEIPSQAWLNFASIVNKDFN